MWFRRLLLAAAFQIQGSSSSGSGSILRLPVKQLARRLGSLLRLRPLERVPVALDRDQFPAQYAELVQAFLGNSALDLVFELHSRHHVSKRRPAPCGPSPRLV